MADPKPEKKEKAAKQPKADKKAKKGKKGGGRFEERPTPAAVQRRIDCFEEYKRRREEEEKAGGPAIPREPIRMTLPDGKVVEGVAGELTPMAVAKGISSQLAKRMIVATVDGAYWDLLRPLEKSGELQLHGFDSPEGKHAFWHSSAHMLGMAMEMEYDCRLCIGPPLEDGGFYYDCEMGDRKVHPDDFAALESWMGTLAKGKHPFERLVMTKDEALEMFSDNEFKKRIIQSKVPDGERCTAYRCGRMIDLCKGPHVPNTGVIKAFSVTKNSSAYWLGKAENESLQRVYGMSFPSAKELKEWQHFMELAALNDHRRLGAEQNLFFFDDVSPGSCFFLPHGTRVYNRLMDFIKSEYWKRGFEEVVTPNCYSTDLWKTSGHYDNYKDNMFLFECEGQEFGIKPMNCLADDHQVLTNRGFMFHDEFVAAFDGDDAGSLRVASYDEAAGALTYERASRYVLNEARARQMVAFRGDRDGLDLLVTPEHDMYVGKGGAAHGSKLAKVRASALLDDASAQPATALRFLSSAKGGVSNAADPLGLPIAAGLGLDTPEQVELAMKVFGLWLADGAIESSGDVRAVRFGAGKAAGRAAFLRDALPRLGASFAAREAGDGTERVDVEDPSWVRFFLSHYPAGSAVGEFPAWVWTASAPLARALLEGMSLGDGSGGETRVRTSSAAVRDSVARLALHAGWTATWGPAEAAAERDAWVVQLATSGGQPAIAASHEHVHEVPYDGLTWCVTVPSGLIWTRRAERDTAGAAVAAGKPVVVGNCPGHCVMFGHTQHSYRELPMRVADFGVLHRNELSGALSGLTRVRRFQQDDAHIFCRVDQIESEIKGALDFLQAVYSRFGFSYELNLSTRPEKYLGDIEVWNSAEAALTECLNSTGHEWKLNPGDGAFYGPKVDIKLTDALNRKHQCATIQLDFQLPIRFDLHYKNEDGVATRPVIVHRAILGSVERFFAIALESFGGKWPLWLSPRQAIVVPVSPKYIEYATEVKNTLHAAGYYCDVDDSKNQLGKSIRNAQLAQYNYILVVGEAECADGTVNVRTRSNEVHGTKPVGALMEQLAQEMADFK